MTSKLVRRELVFPDLAASTRDEALDLLAGSIARHHSTIDGSRLSETLQQRERQGTTAPGDGVAIPHARLAGLERMVVAFGRSRAGIAWDAPDQRPARLILLLAGPADAPDVYLRTLAAASRLLRDSETRSRLLAAADAGELSRILNDGMS